MLQSLIFPADFGLSRALDASHTMTSCGTPQWAAPEVIRGDAYSEKADIYGNLVSRFFAHSQGLELFAGKLTLERFLLKI